MQTEHGVLPPLPADVTVEVERILNAVGNGTSVFMTGSIVEGFGNVHSDVDLYLVQDEGRPEQPVAIGIRQSRYVDCEYFSASALRRLSDRIRTTGWAGIGSLRDAEIDRYYRLAASVPLRVTPEFATVFAAFSKPVACDIFSKSALQRACELLGCAAILEATGEERAADLTLRHAAVWVATAELAADGEGYPSLKWIGEKAARRYGRGSPKFERVVADCLRPTGGLSQRLQRLRERLQAPSELAELLAARTCELASGVRALQVGSDWLFVHQTLGVARVPGPVGEAIANLARGMSWLQATAELSRKIGISCPEAQAGVWHESAKLRSTGFLVEKGCG